jgi:hypothetical protein
LPSWSLSEKSGAICPFSKLLLLSAIVNLPLSDQNMFFATVGRTLILIP